MQKQYRSRPTATGLKKQREIIYPAGHNTYSRVYTLPLLILPVRFFTIANLNLKRKSPQLTTIIVFQIKPSDIIRPTNSSNRMKER